MWGECKINLSEWFCLRITPTYVGRIRHYTPQTSINKDHPHVCGENMDDCMIDGVRWGSPPRMWGESYLITPLNSLEGITPTYVGRMHSLLGGMRRR